MGRSKNSDTLRKKKFMAPVKTSIPHLLGEPRMIDNQVQPNIFKFIPTEFLPNPTMVLRSATTIGSSWMLKNMKLMTVYICAMATRTPILLLYGAHGFSKNGRV